MLKQLWYTPPLPAQPAALSREVIFQIGRSSARGSVFNLSAKKTNLRKDQQILAQVGEPTRIVAGVTVPASERLRKKSAL
ncbi:MAG: hypothetical protein ACI4MR_05845 [Candidatus Aphodomorpha sp.]